jgi:thiamine pyrophosphate-dependent acetolactate synthase large subunit-like protein
MPKVKILYVEHVYEDYNTHSTVQEGLEWEDISEADLKILLANRHEIPEYLGYSPIVVVQKEELVKPTLETILAKVKEKEAAREAAKRKAAEKRAEKEAKKAEVEARKKLKLFKELQKEFEGVLGGG